MHLLIAPNAFKNSLNAGAAAEAIKEGFLQSRLTCTCECFPVGDGGDGTAPLIVKKCGGEFIETAVHDPFGKNITAPMGLIDAGKTAVIEMADASGLRLLQEDELNPLLATSYGTGEQIKIALDKGVQKIIIGMGGSATVDGGCGILAALGIRFLDAAGNAINDLPGNFNRLVSVDLTGLDKRILHLEVVVLCDVDNHLLGGNGAAAMFGPQKGASPSAVAQLDAALATFSNVVYQQTGKDMTAVKYGGTAGGAAAGLFALLNAKLVNGIDYFLSVTGFDAALQKTNLVITGEGSIDEQTLKGKGPFGVARRAKQHQLPVIGLAGKIPLERNHELDQYFDVLMAIGHEPLDLPTALAATEKNLVRTATALGNMLAMAR